MMFNLKLDGVVQLVFNPEATEVMGKNHWHLDEDIDVNITWGAKEISFKILRGFLTDGTSVTRLLHALIPVWDNNTDGVVIHDWLCNFPIVLINGKETTLSRSEIDLLFLEVMKFNGLSKIRRTLMYVGIRAYVLLGLKKNSKELATKIALEEKIRFKIDEETKKECA